ncbi:MAG: CPBP family intramembrane metalloprotease [Acidobacteriaceae bacterium]|nr:CPBP family intramembrane metalloprotease [Acidobacteriaceae bacterium]
MLPDEPDEITPAPVIESEAAKLEPFALKSPAEPFWNYSDLGLITGLLVASVVLILFGVGALALIKPALRNDPTPLLLPTQFLLYGFIYLCFRLVFGLRYGKPVFRSLGWRPSELKLWIVALAGPLLAIAVSGLATLLHTPKVDSPLDKLTETPWSFAIFGVMAVTIAPLFEEMIFRGFLQPLLSRTFGVVAGILVTAALFGALHAPEYSWAWQYAVAVALAGVVFGWLRARTNSIIPSTVMHGCYNALFVVALAVQKHG